METADRLIQSVDRLLNLIMILALIIILLFAGYALWDSYMVLHKTDLSNEVMYFKPNVSNPSLAELQGINADVCAWLTIDDTNIDYPVLQGKDNAEYLNRDIYGEYSLGGSIFLDYRNSKDFSDRYSLIYGHHMTGGKMFGDVERFHDQSYFDTHQTGWLLLPGKTYQLEIFAYLEVDAYLTLLFHLPVEETGWDEMLKHIEEDAMHHRAVQLEDQDRIVALSTCAEGTTNGRMIIVAKMIETELAGGEP